MTVNPQHPTPPRSGERMCLQDYFQLDYSVPERKYEYHDGKVRLMAGGSAGHATIAGNIYMELRLQFRSGPCTVYNSDMRVYVNEDTYYYPDVTVTCNVADRRRDSKLIRSPRLVVEVLSPSTAYYDRTEKLAVYQACPTIYEVALVDQFAPYVQVWRRDEEDEATWHYAHYGPGEVVEFASLDVFVPMEEIYSGIDFDEPLAEE